MKTQISKLLLLLIFSLSFENQADARNHILVNNTIESIFGLQNIEYSYRVTENLTIGAVGTSSDHIKINDIELNGDSVGGIVRYYFEPAFERDSWYLAAFANKTNYEASIVSGGTRYTGKSDNSITAGVGYHWFWDSFNITGALVSSKPSIQLKDSLGNNYKNEFSPNVGIEIKIGGSF